MGSPGSRRRLRRRFRGADRRTARRPRLGGRALSPTRTEMLRVRWLGRVPYHEAHAVQSALHARSDDDYLLLLEHPHVFTLGPRGNPDHVLVDPDSVGAKMIRTDRGGDVTYHGPGQLVAYPIV